MGPDSGWHQLVSGQPPSVGQSAVRECCYNALSGLEAKLGEGHPSICVHIDNNAMLNLPNPISSRCPGISLLSTPGTRTCV